MSTFLSTGDICSELDCLALDIECVTGFVNNAGPASLASKRNIAVRDWLVPRLEKAGYNPRQHMTRREPASAYKHTGGVFGDIAGDLTDKSNTLDLSSIYLSAANDSIYVGMPYLFRGLYAAIFDSPSINPSSLAVTYWDGGRWTAVNSLVDETSGWRGGGRILWTIPDNWQQRPLAADTTYLYWSRIRVSSTPSATTTIDQLLPIRASRLTTPSATQALGLLYREAIGGPGGEWKEKADAFLARAQSDLDMVIGSVRDEFDVDDSEAVGATEQDLVKPDAGEWTWQRG